MGDLEHRSSDSSVSLPDPRPAWPRRRIPAASV
jgi:hypothetical protein